MHVTEYEHGARYDEFVKLIQHSQVSCSRPSIKAKKSPTFNRISAPNTDCELLATERDGLENEQVRQKGDRRKYGQPLLYCLSPNASSFHSQTKSKLRCSEGRSG